MAVDDLNARSISVEEVDRQPKTELKQAAETPAEKYAPYIAGLVARERRRRRRLRERAAQALEVARQAADILRRHYPVTRARVFGSALRPKRFHKRSDIDLAVEGLPSKDYLRAWALLNGSSPDFKHDFEIDLVTPEDCRPAIWESVDREGIDV
jgi:predicted nucleotidyltransferase